MPWLLCMHIYSALMGQSTGFLDFLCFDISLLLLPVALRGYLISIAYCLFFILSPFVFKHCLLKNCKRADFST